MSAITKDDKIVTADMLQDYHDEHVAPFLGGNVLGAQSNFKNSDIYSTTERIVGCWTDGRPLYQVLVPISTDAINTWHEDVVSTAVISNPASVIYRTVQAYIENGNGILYNINNEVGNNNGCGFYLGKASSSNQVCYGTYPNYADFANKTGHMILQYTRTTDAAGSYYLAGENDYSTDEKIIGKWIDGKNIYRKVYAGTTGAVSGSVETAIALDTSYRLNGKKILNIRGGLDYYVSSSDYGRVAFPWYAAANNRAEVQDSGHGSLVIYMCGSFFSNCEYEVVVEYTKTS